MDEMQQFRASLGQNKDDFDTVARALSEKLDVSVADAERIIRKRIEDAHAAEGLERASDNPAEPKSVGIVRRDPNRAERRHRAKVIRRERGK